MAARTRLEAGFLGLTILALAPGPASAQEKGSMESSRQATPSEEDASSGAGGGGALPAGAWWLGYSGERKLPESIQQSFAASLESARGEIRQGRPASAERIALEALRGPLPSSSARQAIEVILEARSRPGAWEGKSSRSLLRDLTRVQREASRADFVRPEPLPGRVILTDARPAAPRARQDPPSEADSSRSTSTAAAAQLTVLCHRFLPGSPRDYFECLEAAAWMGFAGGNLDDSAVLFGKIQGGLRMHDIPGMDESRRELALASALYGLARVRMENFDYGGARALLEEALALREPLLGSTTLVATTLSGLGKARFMAGEYRQALPHYERAVAIWKDRKPDQRADPIVASDNLAQVLWMLGDYSRARQLFEEALERTEREFGSDHRLLAGSLNNYASLLHSVGDFSGARTRYEQAQAIIEKTDGRESMGAAALLNNVGTVSIATGDYAGARDYFERALEITEKTLGIDHPESANPIANLARVGTVLGEPAPRPLFERALRIRERTLGMDHPAVAAILTDLAQLPAGPRGNLERICVAARALAIRLRVFGPGHPEVAESLVVLGDLLPPSVAGSLYARAAALQEDVLGDRHPALATTLVRLALSLNDEGDASAALEAALRAEAIAAEHLAWTARSLSEEEALRYATTRVSALDLALSIAAQGVDGPSRRATLDGLVRSRALVLDEMASRRRSLSHGDPGALAAADVLSRASTRLANLIVRGAADDSWTRYRQIVEDARAERKGAERRLAEALAPLRMETSPARASLSDVVSALPPDSALVSFVRYRPTGKDRTPSYLAFVWTGLEEAPDVIPLGPARAIDLLVRRWREEAVRPLLRQLVASRTVEASYRRAGESLRRRVWDPIEPRIGGVRRVFLVPDGSLHLLNWAALPTGRESYLVESGRLFHYLSAERDLLGHAPVAKTGRGLLALGNPDFDHRPASTRRSAREERPSGRVALLRSAPPGCDAVGSARFETLPGAAREARDVAHLWATHQAGQEEAVVSLTAAEASEAAFKAQASGRRVLHLATHGFVAGGYCETPAPTDARGVGGLVPAESKPRLPGDTLTLSGLALAGANLRGQTANGEEDGILTAAEVAVLDLSGVEWAVLSACNTGLGTVLAGEGVFGLRRAFSVAGARTLIMSLWSVGDETSRRWMRSLYVARLEAGQATDEAVRTASLDLLAERRREGLDTHPHHWAGFVAAGDWH